MDRLQRLISPCSSVAEHFFGKEEVMGPIPIKGSFVLRTVRRCGGNFRAALSRLRSLDNI